MKHLILLTLTFNFAFSLNVCKIGNNEDGNILHLGCNVEYAERFYINATTISCELNELNDVLKENVKTIKSNGCNFNEFNLFKNCTSIRFKSIYEPFIIRRETFNELKQLQLINIRRTNTELLASAFAELPNLREIQIESEDLKVSELAFRGAFQLKILRIEGLEMASLPLGLFRDLNRLEVLTFGSGLTNVNANDLTGMENLKLLNLNYNRIETLTGNFHTLNNLKYLILRSNYIRCIEFSQVHNLIVLDLSRNHIKQLYVSSLSGLTNLRTLILESNIINYIENGAFSSLKMLKKLDLSLNAITELNADTFKGLGNLQYLSLRGNYLSTIDVNTFSALTRINQIDLSAQLELATIDLNAFPQFIDVQTKTVIDTNISSKPDDFEEVELEWLNGIVSDIHTIEYIRKCFFEPFWLKSNQDHQIDLHNLKENIADRKLVIGNLDLDLSRNRFVSINVDQTL